MCYNQDRLLYQSYCQVVIDPFCVWSSALIQPYRTFTVWMLMGLFLMLHCFRQLLPSLTLVHSNSSRFMPSQSDDEAHQLSYLQKHLANIISLLTDSVEGESK